MSSAKNNKLFDGANDELRFWDDARTQAEIDQFRDGTIDPHSADLLRYFQFDDPDFIFESTGNGETSGDLAWAVTPTDKEVRADVFA